MAASDWIDDMIERFVKRERERCAKIADAEAADAQEQIDKNDEYLKKTGDDDQSCNDLCRHATADSPYGPTGSTPMTRAEQIVKIRREINELPANDRKQRAILEARLRGLIMRQLRAEDREDRRKSA